MSAQNTHGVTVGQTKRDVEFILSSAHCESSFKDNEFWRFSDQSLIIVRYQNGRVISVTGSEPPHYSRSPKNSDVDSPGSRAPADDSSGSLESTDFCVPVIEAYTEPGPWWAPETSHSAWTEILINNRAHRPISLRYAVILGDHQQASKDIYLLADGSQTIKIEAQGPEVPGVACFSNSALVLVSGAKNQLFGDQLLSVPINPVSSADIHSGLNSILQVPVNTTFLDMENPGDQTARFSLCWNENTGRCQSPILKMLEPHTAQRIDVPKESEHAVVYVGYAQTTDAQIPFVVPVHHVDGAIKTFSTESGIKFGDTIKDK